MATRSTMVPRPADPPRSGKPHLYTLVTYVRSGPIAEKFRRKNPEISRTIQIRGDQTLEDLHHATFEAFDRFDNHMYEFQLGNCPMEGPRYVLREAFQGDGDEQERPAGRVDETTIDSLSDWMEAAVSNTGSISTSTGGTRSIVVAVEPNVPKGKFPEDHQAAYKSPPQYPDEDEKGIASVN